MARIVNFLLIIVLIAYGYFRFDDMREIFFNPHFTGNDARQQLFPFYTVLEPGVFENDLIYRAMKGYTAPLHWWLGLAITYFTRNPIITGNVIMLVQLGAALGFLFLAVSSWTVPSIGIFSALWLFHTVDLFKNTIGGLPHGWAGAVVAGFFYCLSKKNHWGVLLVILMGCLLHPHSAFIVALSYGLILSYGVMRASTREEYIKPFIRYVVLSPFFVALTFIVVHRPPDIGKMVSLSEAEKMPAFSKNNGRFPFVPLKNPKEEIIPASLKPFFKTKFNRTAIIGFSLYALTLMTLLFCQLLMKTEIIPTELWIFLIGIFSSYSLARIFAFQLYVPIRYLNWPLSIFTISALSVGLWRLIMTKKISSGFKISRAILAPLAFALLATIIFSLGGTGLSDDQNFGYKASLKQESFYAWIRDYTPQNSLIAGHPSMIDGVQLYSARRGYATTETAHPFYDKYFEEISRRLTISLQANYADTAENFLKLVEPEKIDYFAFGSEYFVPKKSKNATTLRNATYFAPFDSLVAKLASRNPDEYFYRQLSMITKDKDYNVVVYRDHFTTLIDIHELRRWFDDKSKTINNLPITSNS